MKTFYDLRSGEKPGHKSYMENLQGKVVWKTKTHWLIYIDPDDYYHSDMSWLHGEARYWTTLIGYIVIPKGVCIRTCYIATGFWDGLKALFRSGETPAVTKTKGEFPEELL
jgi:hypothetical protein